MDGLAAVEAQLRAAAERMTAPPCPPRLGAAIRDALAGGGQRLRSRLCLAAARAAGGEAGVEAAAAGAAAVELIHAASLVHDDLPCFDDAPLRRGRPSVHAAHGEAAAVLVGDALIVEAFGVLAAQGGRGVEAARILARAAGSPAGIAAGQGWEAEAEVDLDHYHLAKTGALFEAAAAIGAAAAGADPAPWAAVGRWVGRGYQVADDLRDAAGQADTLGKPAGRDAALGRPNAVSRLGWEEAVARLERSIAEAVAAVPESPGREGCRAEIAALLGRFRPR